MKKCTLYENDEVIYIEDIVIIIPVYSEKFSPTDIASLRQVKKVLGHYKICFIAPERMRTFLMNRGYIAEFFENEKFDSVATYSELLLTPDFYIRFSKYKYMLIYQLDAFVFSDRLLYFCQLGYDYIGAPWKRLDYGYLNVMVGNGGFCLRRIEACKRVVENRSLLEEWRNNEDKYSLAEDQYFAYCAGRDDVNFHVPEARESLEFSVEKNVYNCYKALYEGWLPFGCHGWTKSYYFSVWYPVMEKFLPDFSSVALCIESSSKLSYKELRLRCLDKYLMERMVRENKNEKIHCAADNVPLLRKLMDLDCIYLWGNGQVSKRAYLLLKILGCRIKGIIDRMANENVNQQCISILTPHVVPYIQPKCIVIATIKYAGEIAGQLEKMGLRHGRDYFYYRELERAMILSYYGVG